MTVQVSGTLTANSLLTIKANFTAPVGANSSYLCDVEVYDLATNVKVAQWFPVQPFVAGQPRTFTSTWTAKPGRYVVKQGVFTPSWGFIAWQNSAVTFQVK